MSSCSSVHSFIRCWSTKWNTLQSQCVIATWRPSLSLITFLTVKYRNLQYLLFSSSLLFTSALKVQQVSPCCNWIKQMPQIDIGSRGPHGDNLYEWLSINGNVATRKAEFNPGPERFLEHLAYCTADLLDCYDWAMDRIPLPSGELSIACHRDPLYRHQVPSLCQSITSEQRIFTRVSRQNIIKEGKEVSWKNERK